MAELSGTSTEPPPPPAPGESFSPSTALDVSKREWRLLAPVPNWRDVVRFTDMPMPGSLGELFFELYFTVPAGVSFAGRRNLLYLTRAPHRPLRDELLVVDRSDMGRLDVDWKIAGLEGSQVDRWTVREEGAEAEQRFRLLVVKRSGDSTVWVSVAGSSGAHVAIGWPPDLSVTMLRLELGHAAEYRRKGELDLEAMKNHPPNAGCVLNSFIGTCAP